MAEFKKVSDGDGLVDTLADNAAALALIVAEPRVRWLNSWLTRLIIAVKSMLVPCMDRWF
jgi:hypothetical protein